MSIEKQAVTEFNTNKKFAAIVIMNDNNFKNKIGLNFIFSDEDLKKLIELFKDFKKEKGSKKEREEMEEYERNARQKLEDEENERKRPGFSEALLKWMLLIDMGFNLFCKKSKNKGKNKADIAAIYYNQEGIDFLKNEFEKKSINSSQNQHDC